MFSPTRRRQSTVTRRELLRMAALAGLGGMALGVDCATAQAEPFTRSSLTVQREPLAIAMWDYSWLTRRSGLQSEFADFDAVLDGFVLRGYNAVRIDAFPHLIADDASGARQSTFQMRPQWGGFPWGNSDYVTISPREALPEFLRKCAARGLRVALSTWLTDDTSGRGSAIAGPRDLARCWAETLEFLGEEGLLGIVEWVDLANEFPSVSFMPSVVNFINDGLAPGDQIGRLQGYFRSYSPAQAAAISAYMDQAIGALKPRFPELSFCFSLLGDGTTEPFAHHDLSCFDLIETHIWLSQNAGFGLSSGLSYFLIEGFSPIQTPLVNRGVEKLANHVYFSRRTELLDWMGTALDSWVELGNRLSVPIYTTEAWASTNYFDLSSQNPDTEAWDWIFDAATAAATMAKQRGWSGICSSNFCEPMFPAFYDDVGWHQQFTALVRGQTD